MHPLVIIIGASMVLSYIKNEIRKDHLDNAVNAASHFNAEAEAHADDLYDRFKDRNLDPDIREWFESRNQ